MTLHPCVVLQHWLVFAIYSGDKITNRRRSFGSDGRGGVCVWMFVSISLTLHYTRSQFVFLVEFPLLSNTLRSLFPFSRYSRLTHTDTHMYITYTYNSNWFILTRHPVPMWTIHSALSKTACLPLHVNLSNCACVQFSRFSQSNRVSREKKLKQQQNYRWESECLVNKS